MCFDSHSSEPCATCPDSRSGSEPYAACTKNGNASEPHDVWNVLKLSVLCSGAPNRPFLTRDSRITLYTFLSFIYCRAKFYGGQCLPHDCRVIPEQTTTDSNTTNRRPFVATFNADSRIARRAHAVPLLCRALIHICYAAPLPCSDCAVSFVNVRMLAGNVRLLVQQCNIIFFAVCSYHSFSRP
jgi:hypothetical protein